MISIQDISDLHELKIMRQQQMDEIASLNNELEQDRKIIDANLMIIKANSDCMVIDATEAFYHFSGFTPEELADQPISNLHATDMTNTDYLQMKEELQLKKKWTGEVEVKRKEGEIVWMDAVISPFLDIDGNVVSYTAIYHDITDKKRIQRLSITDPLTKLYNRQKFNDVADEMFLRQHWTPSNTFGMLIIDVDHFKNVNDTYGHQVGDNVLVAMAETLTNAIRRDDVLARWGGEEFVILLPDVDSEKAFLVADKYRQTIEQIMLPEVGRITASIGVTVFTSGDTGESMMFRADLALYRAKKNGRNRVESA